MQWNLHPNYTHMLFPLLLISLICFAMLHFDLNTCNCGIRHGKLGASESNIPVIINLRMSEILTISGVPRSQCSAWRWSVSEDIIKLWDGIAHRSPRERRVSQTMPRLAMEFERTCWKASSATGPRAVPRRSPRPWTTIPEGRGLTVNVLTSNLWRHGPEGDGSSKGACMMQYSPIIQSMNHCWLNPVTWYIIRVIHHLGMHRCLCNVAGCVFRLVCFGSFGLKCDRRHHVFFSREDSWKRLAKLLL